MPAQKRKKKTTRSRARLTEAARKNREKAIIKDLKAGVLSYRKIADKYKVSLPTVNAKARKANISRPRGRRPMSVAASAVRRSATKVRRRATARPAKRMSVRRSATQPRTIRKTSSTGHFQDAFREMVLRYYPTITLKQFDRLAKMVNKAIS